MGGFVWFWVSEVSLDFVSICEKQLKIYSRVAHALENRNALFALYAKKLPRVAFDVLCDCNAVCRQFWRKHVVRSSSLVRSRAHTRACDSDSD